MRWFLAALAFAAAVALAIATAAIRADNARYRHAVERIYQGVNDRIVEQRRLAIARLAEASPQRLAELQWQHLRQARQRLEQLQ